MRRHRRLTQEEIEQRVRGNRTFDAMMEKMKTQISMPKIQKEKIKDESRYDTYEEMIQDFIPSYQKEFCKGPTFRFLCIMFKEYLENDFNQNNLSALKIAIESFNDFVRISLQRSNDSDLE